MHVCYYHVFVSCVCVCYIYIYIQGQGVEHIIYRPIVSNQSLILTRNIQNKLKESRSDNYPHDRFPTYREYSTKSRSPSLYPDRSTGALYTQVAFVVCPLSNTTATPGYTTCVCVCLQGTSYLGAGSEGDGDADQRGPGLQRTLLQLLPTGRSGGHRVMAVIIHREPVPKTQTHLQWLYLQLTTSRGNVQTLVWHD